MAWEYYTYGISCFVKHVINDLELLPKTELVNLRELEYRGNELVELPEIICKLVKLQKLFCVNSG